MRKSRRSPGSAAEAAEVVPKRGGIENLTTQWQACADCSSRRVRSTPTLEGIAAVRALRKSLNRPCTQWSLHRGYSHDQPIEKVEACSSTPVENRATGTDLRMCFLRLPRTRRRRRWWSHRSSRHRARRSQRIRRILPRSAQGILAPRCSLLPRHTGFHVEDELPHLVLLLVLIHLDAGTFEVARHARQTCAG